MADYNKIMETLEKELIGRDVRVTLDYLDGPNKVVFKDRLEDAFYEVTKTSGREITLEDARTGNFPGKTTEELNVKRVSPDEEEVRYHVDVLRLRFADSEVTLSGYNLSLGKSRFEPGYHIGDGLDNPLILNLQEVN